MSHDRVRESIERLTRWLANHAPRTRAGLLPPLGEADLAECARSFGRPVPEGFASLYLALGGQSAAPAPGILRGYTLMPREGVDGFLLAREQMVEATAGGAPWASLELFPFAKDFGGNYLCVDARSGRIVEIIEGEIEDRASSMESLVASVAVELDDGELTLVDEPDFEVEVFEVVFDASRPRSPGDRVTHSVFEKLGIEGTVEPLEKLLASPFDAGEGPRHGFAARLVPQDPALVRFEVKHLADGAGHVLRVEHGKQSGGGKPGVAVYVVSERPLPPGCRLHIEVHRLRPR